MQGEKEIKCIDLFGGIGGFRYGLEKTNKKFKFIWYCDNKKEAIQIYNKNFKENYKPTDITTIKPTNIPDFDILCGGFPCQSFSVAGKRKGFQDIRGTLFFEMCRIIQEKKPKLLLLENVKGLLSNEYGRTFFTIMLQLEKLGYNVEWQIINSRYYNSAQTRERVFIIGHLREKCIKTILPVKGINNEISKIFHQVTGETPSGISRQGDRIYGVDGTSPTLTASFKPPLIYHDGIIRYLTPVECERLQGFPDDWTAGLSDNKRYDLIGNSVTVNVVSNIGKKLLEVYN